MDEIHKHYRWKRHLKGLYDTLESPCDILVTGSARLNIYRRQSDSMAGRFFHFRLHPFSIGELATATAPSPEETLAMLESGGTGTGQNGGMLGDLLEYGPFPEPLLAQDARIARIWRRNRDQMVVRDDLRDISRLPELGDVEMLAALLPERVGSLLSHTSLGEILGRPSNTIKRWMEALGEVYYAFEIKPWTKSIPRSLRKQGKWYLWDYGAVPDQAARFENLVACHLLKSCDFWTDCGYGDFRLHFLRNKEKQELDFLIVRDGEPWLPVEVKSGKETPDTNWGKFAPLLPCRFGVQVTMKPGWKVHAMGASQVLVANAADVLGCFP